MSAYQQGERSGAAGPYQQAEVEPWERGSTVEQVHRILTTEAYREVDPWLVAEEIVAFVKVRTAWRGPKDKT